MFLSRSPFRTFLIAFSVWFMAGGSPLLGQNRPVAAVKVIVRGIVHDPMHRPIAGAQVTFTAPRGTSFHMASDGQGRFQWRAPAPGRYAISIQAKGFRPLQRRVDLRAGISPVLHFPLQVLPSSTVIQVIGRPEQVHPHSAAAATVVNHAEIAETPGALRTNSLAMITDYVPGAYIVHNQLHIRGGHQVSWIINGVDIPNTAIASNLGPQLAPESISSLQVERGGASAQFGDRTYGVLNATTHSGFNHNNDAELVASYGSYQQTDDTLNLGGHTTRFAYFASLEANRGNYGLETPTPAILHDADWGGGGLATVTWNAGPLDQIEATASLRRDQYQVPNTPAQQAAGSADIDREGDGFADLNWTHTFSANLLLNVAPFVHSNAVHYWSAGAGASALSSDQLRMNYAGVQTTLRWLRGKHTVSGGLDVFGEGAHNFIGLPAAGNPLSSATNVSGGSTAAFASDQYQVTPWLTLNGGLRGTRFVGLVTENALSPRLGADLILPRLKWVLHGFYGRFYQEPPLDTIQATTLGGATAGSFAFLPLHGERDEQYDVGISAPVGGWLFNVDNFRQQAYNFFDHDAIGNSNIFLPLTLNRARIHGWDGTLRSPDLLHRVRLHAAFSHQYVQGWGGVTGGLTDFTPPEFAYYFLDHDQRNTVSAGAFALLPAAVLASVNVNYGSGFLQGDGPAHLPAHTSVDLGLGKDFGERWHVQLTALNVGNNRFLLDESNSFGGTHYYDPRQVLVQVRYRFHY